MAAVVFQVLVVFMYDDCVRAEELALAVLGGWFSPSILDNTQVAYICRGIVCGD